MSFEVNRGWLYSWSKSEILTYREDNHEDETTFWIDSDAEVRRYGYQTGLETPVVHTVNHECQNVIFFQEIDLLANAEAFRLGSTVARLKLKGIDGSLNKRWSIWFNAI